MSDSNSSPDETIEMSNPPSVHVEPVKPARPDSMLEETVKMTTKPGRDDAPDSQTQPTQRVDVAPMSETQPTMPVVTSALADKPGAASPQSPPVTPPSPGGGEPPPFIRRGSGFNLPPLSRWTLMAAAGIGIVVILVCIVLWLSVGRSLFGGGGLFKSDTPTPTATLTPTVTSTPRPSPTSPPTNTPVLATPTSALPTATPRPAPTALEVGVLAKVTPPEGLKLKVRAAAGVGGELLGELEAETQVKIVEGPVEANNLKWWKVDNSQGLVGWSAEGAGGDIYLVPVGWAP